MGSMNNIIEKSVDEHFKIIVYLLGYLRLIMVHLLINY